MERCIQGSRDVLLWDEDKNMFFSDKADRGNFSKSARDLAALPLMKPDSL